MFMDRKTILSLIYEKPETPYRFRIGARVIKTVAAAFLCAAIGHFRGEPTFFSMIAAVICMQNTAEKTLNTAVNRTAGTLIGGVCGVGILYLAKFTGLQRYMLAYYALVCLMLIPLIESTLAINKPSAATITCAAFLSVTVYHLTDASPMSYALNRILDTMFGILAALVINLAFPIRNPDPSPVPAPAPEVPEDAETK